MSKLEFVNRIVIEPDGSVSFSCWTFEKLEEHQIKSAETTIELMIRYKKEIIDYAENGGKLIKHGNHYYTGCYNTYKALMFSGAKESKNKHKIKLDADGGISHKKNCIKGLAISGKLGNVRKVISGLVELGRNLGLVTVHELFS